MVPALCPPSDGCLMEARPPGLSSGQAGPWLSCVLATNPPPASSVGVRVGAASGASGTQQGGAGLDWRCLPRRWWAGSRVSCSRVCTELTTQHTHTSFGLCAMPGGDLVPQVTGPDLRSSRMARPAAVTRQDLRALSQELVLGHVSWLQRRGQESELGQTVGAAGSRCT